MIPMILTLAGFLVASAQATDLDQWLNIEKNHARSYMLQNISPRGAAIGAVVAATSTERPNYGYHWIRDAAITMNTVLSLPVFDGQENLMWDYVYFSRRNQLTDNPSGKFNAGGLGEPKFNLDGSAYMESWGRPQNDGPALRAITLTRFAMQLLQQHRDLEVKKYLFEPKLPASTVIKADLEYVSHHWMESSFDAWEEVNGHHFFHLMVTRRALLDGAVLADLLKDPQASIWYREQAKAIESAIPRFWNASKGYIVSTVSRKTNDAYAKESGLDTTVILGILYGHRGDGYMELKNEKVLATAKVLVNTFKNLYSINEDSDSNLAPALGRYPEDTYDGYRTDGEGNPWFLITAAFADYAYRIGNLKMGDAFLNRVKKHTAASGALSEQINRKNGYMQGAENLTWSYAAFLDAVRSRALLLKTRVRR